MILGFKDRFIPYVLDGSKTHTIRAGNRWKAGMRADLFRNVRQKDMALIFRAPVVRVEEIRIELGDPWISVFVAGVQLSADEANAFFFRDGFRTDGDHWWTREAYYFWQATNRLPFTGQIIHWDYARAIRPPAALSALGKRIHTPESGWVHA